MFGCAEDARCSVTCAIEDRLLDEANDRFALAWTIKPPKIRLFTEPDQLAPRVSSVLLNDERARFRFTTHAAKHLHHLPVHESAKRSRVWRNATREQGTYFVLNAARELFVYASLHAFSRQLGRQPQRNRCDID